MVIVSMKGPEVDSVRRLLVERTYRPGHSLQYCTVQTERRCNLKMRLSLIAGRLSHFVLSEVDAILRPSYVTADLLHSFR